MKNVITLGKLIGLLLLFCLLLLLLLSVLFLKTPTSYINVHTKNTRNELARLGMETIFLVIIVKLF